MRISDWSSDVCSSDLLQRRRQPGGLADPGALRAEPFGHTVVAGGQQLAADQAFGAVVVELDLVFGIPARVVAHHANERQAIAHGRIEHGAVAARSEEHTSELQSLMRISYDV